MSRQVLFTMMLLGACSSGEPPPADEALPVPPVPVMAPLHPEAIKITQSLRRAKQKELSAVVAPDVTVDRIAEIKEADGCARQAVGFLLHHGTDPLALANARRAVQGLEQVLDQNQAGPKP